MMGKLGWYDYTHVIGCGIAHVLTLVFIPVICLMLLQMQYANAARLDLILQRGL